MSTRSRIAIALPCGEYKSIYCHWDGYPANNGRLLYNHYTEFTKVNRLMELGCLSSLGEVIGRKHDFNFAITMRSKKGSWPALLLKRYEALIRQCNAYGRDRGEVGWEASHYGSLEELVAIVKAGCEEWVYLWLDEHWLYAPVCSMLSPNSFVVLTPEAWTDEKAIKA